MANIYCWLNVETMNKGASVGLIAHCGKEKECVEFAKSLDIFSGEIRDYIAGHARWMADKVNGKFRVRITAGGDDEPKVERIFNLKVIKR